MIPGANLAEPVNLFMPQVRCTAVASFNPGETVDRFVLDMPGIAWMCILRLPVTLSESIYVLRTLALSFDSLILQARLNGVGQQQSFLFFLFLSLSLGVVNPSLSFHIVPRYIAFVSPTALPLFCLPPNFLVRIQGYANWNRHCSSFRASPALYKVPIPPKEDLTYHQSNMGCFRQVFRCLIGPFRREKGRVIEIVSPSETDLMGIGECR